MEDASSSSFVSKARTAFHSAAAKAEKVLTEIKSDLKPVRGDYSDKQSSPIDSKNLSFSNSPDNIKGESKHLKWRPAPIVTKQDWHDRLKSIGIRKKGVDDTEKPANLTMSFTIFDENLYEKSPRNISEPKGSEMASPSDCSNDTTMDKIPSVSVLRQLAIAVEAGKMHKSMNDFLASSRDSSPVRERSGLSLSAMKSLVLREKEEKITSEWGDDEKVVSWIHSLIDSDIRRGANSQKEAWLLFRDPYHSAIFS